MVASGVHRNLPLIGLLLGFVFWVLDAAVDIFLFGDPVGFRRSLLKPEATEIWMRCVVVLLLTLFGFYARYSLNRLRQSHLWMEEYRDQLEKEIQARKETERALQKLAVFDPLTAVYNRRFFNQALRYEIERSRRYQTHLSVLICDLDHFKEINDTYGHSEGDRILKAFAERIGANIRRIDRLARWGGEEFIILTPGLDADKAAQLAEKLRSEVETCAREHLHGLTVSFGVTQYHPGESEAAFINRADVALYRSKKDGRNRVSVGCG